MGVAPEHISMEWEDVTAQFTTTSASLKIGQIISAPAFSLREAMAAIELMDPKMDIGLGSANVLTLAEIEARNGLPKVEDLSLAECLSLMDSWTIAEQMHYEGHHLASCLLTCYYMHEPRRLLEKRPILLAFALTLLRRCYYIRECILKANMYFEEDFIHWNFGLDIGDSLKDAEVKDLISSVIESEQARLSEIKDEEERKMATAIVNRLKYNKALYLSQLLLSSEVYSDTNKANEYLREAIGYIPSLIATASLAQNPEKFCSSPTAGSAASAASTSSNPTGIKIFEYEIMRRWTNSTPPTFVAWASFETAITRWQTALTQLLEVNAFKEKPMSVREAKEKQLELTVEQKVCLLVRARFVTLVWRDFKHLGHRSLYEVLLEDVTQSFGMTAQYAKADEKTSLFHFELCETGFADLMRVNGMIRARARRRLPHIFEHWGTLLYDADILDMKSCGNLKISAEPERPRGFARWHMDLIQQMISDYLTIGFELALYEHYEIPMIWWYLDNIASARQKSQLKVLEANAEAVRQQEARKQANLKAKTGRGGGAKRSAAAAPSSGDASAPPKLNWYAMELEAKFQLTRGLFLYIAALDAAGLFAPSKQNISSAATRFFSRFHPLLNLQQPQGLRFAQYQTTYLDVVKERTPADLLTRANKSIQAALKAFQDLSAFSSGDTNQNPPPCVTKEAQQLLTLTLKNGFQIASLLKGTALAEVKSDSHVANLDFSTHRAFPIIAVKQKPAKK